MSIQCAEYDVPHINVPDELVVPSDMSSFLRWCRQRSIAEASSTQLNLPSLEIPLPYSPFSPLSSTDSSAEISANVPR